MPSRKRCAAARPGRGGCGATSTCVLADVEGRACVSALFYNARDPLERYNMADTLKAQFTAFLTAGRVLYSDMGRVLCSIVADGCGWHDTISGTRRRGGGHARFGETARTRTLRNDRHRNGRDNLLVELGKHGLGKRDVVANVNFFVRVGVGEDGALGWVAGNSRPGASVELRFEMDTLVVLSNTPHPLDPGPATGRRRSSSRSGTGPAAREDDPCRLSRPENGRGFALTEAYVLEPEEREGRPVESARPADADVDVTLPAGQGWTHELGPGDRFRIVDLEGNQAVDTLFFNSRDLDERYSATETIRGQGNIYLTTGTRLMSSEGRPLLTIVADTCGRHDTLGGACSAESNQVRYDLGKKYMHNCRDSFLLALARYGAACRSATCPATSTSS